MFIISLHEDTWRNLRSLLSSSSYTYRHDPQTPNILVHCHLVNPKGYDVVRLYTPRGIHARRLQPVFSHFCARCMSTDLRFSQWQDTMTCAACGEIHSEHHSLGDPGRPTSRDGRPREHSHNTYKRMNHFRFWLNRLQGHESTKLDAPTLESIRAVLAEDPTSAITYDRIRAALRRLRLQRYYNNTYSILRRLTGEALVEFSPQHETQLLEMFRQIQQPFSNHRDSRVNMLGYVYVIRKFCEILGWQDLAVQLPHLKSREKTRSQDVIWKHVCQELGLPFYRSIA